jgi:predicted AAA+ superfamily ATPase
LWLRGGYPDALLTRDAPSWHAWQESYLRTFIERDIARHQLNLSSAEVRRLLTMLAHSHGGLLNHSTLGRSLGYSYHTIQSMLDLFAGYFLIYLRDSGILHYLLGIGTADQLLTSPGRGNSFEGFMIQQITALEELQHSGSAFYFYRTHAGAEIDLLIDRGSHRVGFEFKAGVATEADDWKHLQAGIDDDVMHKGYVVYNGTREFQVSDKISVIPATQLLSGKLP